MPTATTRRPARAPATGRAVGPGTAKRSGVGGSCIWGLDTPACSTTGQTTIPRAIRRTSSGAVKGRRALGISALPGSVAYTVWWSESGWRLARWP